MAFILNPIDVICDMNKIVVRDDGEAWGGSEPYLWSVFFKIDGEDENVTAEINVNRIGFSLTLNGVPSVTSPAGSHGNLRLEGGSVSAPDRVDVSVPNSVGRFRSSLVPIPVTITIEEDSWVVDAAQEVMVVLQDLFDSISGNRLCPPLPLPTGEFLGEFVTEFVSGTVGGLPATFGAVYILMEQDFTGDDVAEDARRALRDGLKDELTETIIPGISFNVQAPTAEAMTKVQDRLQKLVTDAVFDGINWWWLILGVPGFLVATDQDDFLGTVQPMMSHLDISSDQEVIISENFIADNGNGDWGFRGKIGVDF